MVKYHDHNNHHGGLLVIYHDTLVPQTTSNRVLSIFFYQKKRVEYMWPTGWFIGSLDSEMVIVRFVYTNQATTCISSQKRLGEIKE